MAEEAREIVEEETSPWMDLFKVLTSSMSIAIWLALIIEFSLKNFLDGIVLTVVLFLNAFITYHEKTKAGNAIAALKNNLRPTASVIRNGEYQTIDASFLVPGDVIILSAGKAIPADCILMAGEAEIDVDEAALTGESMPVTYFDISHAENPEEIEVIKQGSTCVRGEAKGIVQYTGK